VLESPHADRLCLHLRKLGPSLDGKEEILSTPSLVIEIVTNRFGDIVFFDDRVVALLGVSTSRARSLNLLPFIVDGRLDIARDLRAVTSEMSTGREVQLQPKERRRRKVRISMREAEAGIQWTIELADGEELSLVPGGDVVP
jgi:PAS domain-containing protein